MLLKRQENGDESEDAGESRLQRRARRVVRRWTKKKRMENSSIMPSLGYIEWHSAGTKSHSSMEA
jgi:hypothetical protein